MVQLSSGRPKAPSLVGNSDNSFKPFQALPSLVRETLAWGEGYRRAHGKCEVEDLVNRMISRYDMNQALPIGELVTIMDRFMDRGLHVRMVHCYVDNHCNMLTAKLAWREDY